jgi:hypothetical protein
MDINDVAEYNKYWGTEWYYGSEGKIVMGYCVVTSASLLQ